MVMMFMGEVVLMLEGILYYSYHRKPMEREFFVLAQKFFVTAPIFSDSK
jgi:hypothetical protein